MSITLDDRDLSIIYDGSWFHGGLALFEYDNTTTATSTAGSMAFINFTGVSISVFGTVGPISYGGTQISSYQVDDEPAVVFTAPAQEGTLYHYNFFTSSTLANAPHQLKITNLNQSCYLWLDYVQYTPLSATSSSSTSPANTNGQQPIPTSSSNAPEPQTDPSSPSSSWTLATSSSSLSPNTQQQTATSSSSSSTASGTQTEPSSSSSLVPQTSVQTTQKNNAPVIGGVVGGVVLVVAALALIFLLWRRRNTRALVEEKNVDNARNAAEASVSEVRSNDNLSIMSNAPLVGPDDCPCSNRPQHSSVVPSSVIAVRSVSWAEDSEADTFLPRQIVNEEQVYQHEDGGVRVADGQLHEQVVDIPPEYREYE